MDLWLPVGEWIKANEALAAWVEAIGTLSTVVIAAVLWRLDGKRALKRERQDKHEHLRRLITGLRAEIDTALVAAEMLENRFRATAADEPGGSDVRSHDVRLAARVITDATVYRAIAADIGRVPREIVESATRFYGLAHAIEGMIALGGDDPVSLQEYANMLRRLRILGRWVIKFLDKLRDADFDEKADLPLTDEELEALARQFGFTRERVLRELGIKDE